MKRHFLLTVLLLGCACSIAQLSRDSISTDFVLYQRRLDFDKNMRNRIINATFATPIDSNTEDQYREASWAISQFLLRSVEIEKRRIWGIPYCLYKRNN